LLIIGALPLIFNQARPKSSGEEGMGRAENGADRERVKSNASNKTN